MVKEKISKDIVMWYFLHMLCGVFASAEGVRCWEELKLGSLG